jgi:hypothetical protein
MFLTVYEMHSWLTTQMHGVTLPNRGPGSHAFISGQRDKATVMQALCEDPFSLFNTFQKCVGQDRKDVKSQNLEMHPW